MKKFAAILMAIVFVLTLVACAGNDGQKEDKKFARPEEKIGIRAIDSAVFDIDGDETEEDCYLSVAATLKAGTAVTLTVYRGEKMQYKNTFRFASEDVSFCRVDGEAKLVVVAADGEKTYMDITADGRKIRLLTGETVVPYYGGASLNSHLMP